MLYGMVWYTQVENSYYVHHIISRSTHISPLRNFTCKAGDNKVRETEDQYLKLTINKHLQFAEMDTFGVF